MRVKVKRLHKDAVVGSYVHNGDAGIDLTAVSKEHIGENLIKYGFGLSFEIPEGFVGFIFPRSSIYKKQQMILNSVGVVDSNFRGEVSVIMNDSDNSYQIGERVAQLVIMPHPYINLVEVEELTNTTRGNGGYGSTGV